MQRDDRASHVVERTYDYGLLSNLGLWGILRNAREMQCNEFI